MRGILKAKIPTVNRHLTRCTKETKHHGKETSRELSKRNCSKVEFMSLPGPSLTIVVPETLACDVYIGCLPLRLPPFIPKALPSALARHGMKHFYTLVKQPSDDACMFYDFLPANPEDPLSLAAAVTGQRVKGIIQEKKLKRFPKQKCWWVGKTETRNGFESARDFNSQWDLMLSLCRHDCRHHTNGLVHHLTGKEDVISQLDAPGSEKGFEMGEGWEDFLASISIADPYELQLYRLYPS